MSRSSKPKPRDPEALYAVQLLKPIQVGRTWIRPGPGLRMKGRLVDGLTPDELGEVSAQPVAPVNADAS